MKNEDQAQLLKKINNLKTKIQKKHGDPQNNPSKYIQILQEIQNKDFYLSKKSPTVTKLYQLQKQNQRDFQKQKSILLNNKRKQIHEYNNELFQLNNYMNMRNKLRTFKVKAAEENHKQELIKKLHLFQEQENKNESKNQTLNQDISNGPNYNRLNPFQGVKIQKFLEVFRQFKNRQKTDPKSEQRIKFPGIGIENTPLYDWKKQQKSRLKNNNLGSSNSLNNKKNRLDKNKIKYLGQAIDKIYLRNKWMFEIPKQQKKLFQKRLQKIIDLQGQFWNKTHFL